jgi:hypothetical protein
LGSFPSAASHLGMLRARECLRAPHPAPYSPYRCGLQTRYRCETNIGPATVVCGTIAGARGSTMGWMRMEKGTPGLSAWGAIVLVTLGL